MPDSYPIIQVEPEWVLEDEDMGTREKFWYRKPGDGENKWLFKHPRSNTGEHWAEKIAAEETKRAFARHLILDAVIGNTDRHHENWGMLRRRVGEHEAGWLGPSFDHASSLGRELLDRKRILRLEEDTVGAYSERARGQIFWSDETQRAPSPLDLVRKAVVGYPSYFGPALGPVAEFRDAHVTDIVDRVPRDWMSRPAREFASKLITYNRDRLMELNR